MVREGVGIDMTADCVSFDLSRELYEAARRRAEAEGRTVSQLARDALEKYLAAG